MLVSPTLQPQWEFRVKAVLVLCRPLLVGLLSFSAHAAAAVQVDSWPLPVATRASQPNLVADVHRCASGLVLPTVAADKKPAPHSLPRCAGAADSALYLSWIEPDGKGHQLRYAREAGEGFEPAREIARGENWFVNWADFPALAVLADGSLVAHFLQKSAAAPYAYDVRLTRSLNGSDWSAPETVHDDGTTTEHGFVSLWPWSAGEVAVAWLDGRRTGGSGHDGHGTGDGAMTLRAAVFDARGKRQEWELDAGACDCCQTDAALTQAGPVLVYRDRAEGEIRDIALTRYRDGQWTAPVRVHADNWFMPACPVNGPAVVARGREVYVAWYTAVDNEPQLRLARSSDDGEHFDAPKRIATGPGVQGRVDLALDDDALFASWLSEDAQAQTLWLARYPLDLASEPERIEVAKLARGRGTGFPRLALRDGVAHLVWTDIVGKQPRLRGARVAFPR